MKHLIGYPFHSDPWIRAANAAMSAYASMAAQYTALMQAKHQEKRNKQQAMRRALKALQAGGGESVNTRADEQG